MHKRIIEILETYSLLTIVMILPLVKKFNKVCRYIVSKYNISISKIFLLKEANVKVTF